MRIITVKPWTGSVVNTDCFQQLRAINIEEKDMKKWECIVCGFIYDEALGLPEEGIAPGTAWADIPDNWVCPECGIGKEDFEMVEAG